MEKQYFIDTCVWRDFYEDRTGPKGRPLGKHAAELFTKIMKQKEKIVYTETLLWELKKKYSKKEIDNLLKILILTKTLKLVKIQKEEFDQAKELSNQRKLPLVDCLNAVSARNHNCIMISQDKHLIKDLADIVVCKRPEEIN